MSTQQRFDTIHEPAREVDIVHATDVLVVGSGPAGLAAALAAARAGVEVTLVERYGCFGGNITTVGVEGMAWYRHEQTVEANGIGREFETPLGLKISGQVLSVDGHTETLRAS